MGSWGEKGAVRVWCSEEEEEEEGFSPRSCSWDVEHCGSAGTGADADAARCEPRRGLEEDGV